VFNSQETKYQTLKNILESLAQKHKTSSATIALSFVLHHPIQAIPVVGTTQNHRFDSLLESVRLKLDHEEWYRIYSAHPSRKLR